MGNQEVGSYQKLIDQLLSDGSEFTLLYLQYSFKRFDFIRDPWAAKSREEITEWTKHSLRQILIQKLDQPMITAISQTYPELVGQNLFFERLVLADALYSAIMAT